MNHIKIYDPFNRSKIHHVKVSDGRLVYSQEIVGCSTTINEPFVDFFQTGYGDKSGMIYQLVMSQVKPKPMTKHYRNRSNYVGINQGDIVELSNNTFGVFVGISANDLLYIDYVGDKTLPQTIEAFNVKCERDQRDANKRREAARIAEIRRHQFKSVDYALLPIDAEGCRVEGNVTDNHPDVDHWLIEREIRWFDTMAELREGCSEDHDYEDYKTFKTMAEADAHMNMKSRQKLSYYHNF